MAVGVRVGRLRPQQNENRMYRNVVVIEQQRVVSQEVGVFPGRGARLKLDVNDFLQRFADAQDKVSRLGDGR